MDLGLTNATAIVVAGGRGMGLASARCLADDGAPSVSKNLSLLLAKDEILVNVVSPGSIASESLVVWATSVGVDGTDPYRLMDAIAEHFGHPAHLPRAGPPHEMCSVAAFLASRRNSYMTGANVNVDGGSDLPSGSRGFEFQRFAWRRAAPRDSCRMQYR